MSFGTYDLRRITEFASPKKILYSPRYELFCHHKIQSVNISSLIHKVASCRFSGKVYYMADSAAARCSEFCALIGPSCSLGISRVGPLRESSLFGRMMNRGY